MIWFLVFHIIFVASAAGLVLAILYHYRQYSPLNDKLRWVMWFFVAIIILFIIISTVYFFNIPWKEVNFYVKSAS